MAPKHPPGPAMTLGNMRELGVKRLIASCLNDACRHQGADRRVELIRPKPKCRGSQPASCVPSAAAAGNKIDVRPNWKEQPTRAKPDRQGVAMSSNHFRGCDLRHRFCDSDGDDCAFLFAML